MTIKLGSLSRWRPYMSTAVVLEGNAFRERRIRLHVNCESETAFYRVFEGVDDQQLIAVAGAGLDVIEFAAKGEVRWIAVPVGEAQVWYQTADVEPTYAAVHDPVIFTRIANRRHRNPELEEIMYRMQLNVERRLSQQAAEFESALARRRTEEENGRPAEIVTSDAPGAAAGAGGEEVRSPEPADKPAAEGAGGADGGE